MKNDINNCTDSIIKLNSKDLILISLIFILLDKNGNNNPNGINKIILPITCLTNEYKS